MNPTEIPRLLGTRLVRVADDLDKLFGARAENGDRLTYEWGEPDAEGVYEPIITRHADDNLITAERERIRREIAALVMWNARPAGGRGVTALIDKTAVRRVIEGEEP